MDADRFDAIARLLGAPSTRRCTLGGLIGGALTGAAAASAAGRNRRGQKATEPHRRRSQVQGDCANPGPGKNLNGCDFAGEDFSGDDLSSSNINDATFRNAELVGSDLSGSGLRRTSFRGANLCSADLSSTSLKETDFRGSTGPTGRRTNLTRADLSDANCRGAEFDAKTIFCGTKMCNGKIRNDDCPPGVDPKDVCCTETDCPSGHICRNGLCIPNPGTCTAGQNLCEDPGTSTCNGQITCDCVITTSGASFCGQARQCSNCAKDEDCSAVTGVGSVCSDASGRFCGCAQTNRRVCVGPCGPCTSNAQCGDFQVCCGGQCQVGDCCTTADCGAGETCKQGICTCDGCRSSGTCRAGDAWGQCGDNGAPCAACASGRVCAAGSQRCVSCEFGRAGGTWCDARDDFATYQCSPNCACATNPQGFGACFGGTAYCRRGPEQICEFAADCVIEGLGTDCVLAGDCEAGCRTVCVTRCGAGAAARTAGAGEGPLRLVVLD